MMDEYNEKRTNDNNSNNHTDVGVDSTNNNDSDKLVFINKSRNIIYYVLGVFEVLLIFRLLFKSLNARPTNTFVSIIYGFTDLLVAPFVGIFNIISAGNGVTYVIEPATIIAMVVYSLLAYGIIKLIKVTLIDN